VFQPLETAPIGGRLTAPWVESLGQASEFSRLCIYPLVIIDEESLLTGIFGYTPSRVPRPSVRPIPDPIIASAMSERGETLRPLINSAHHSPECPALAF
jgi:hypothetical protein